MRKDLTFDDIRIVPRYVSEVNSRSEVDTFTMIDKIPMQVPVILPGMHSLYGPSMVSGVTMGGGLVVHPRGGTNPSTNSGSYYMSFGMPNIRNVNLENALSAAHELALDTNSVLVIELNNGYLKKLHDKIREIHKFYPELRIWAGAVCSIEGCRMLADAGATAVIVGNGVGSVCETTPRTAVGLPPVATLLECINSPIPVILAGGIKKYGDIVLSLILGAEAVMIGGLLASTTDNPNQGRYWGEASSRQKHDNINLADNLRVSYVEGREVQLTLDKISACDRIKEIKEAIQSACSFVGARNINELRTMATLEELK